MKQGKITIIDIAEKTGLSKGTVDRVIHNRGEVSAKSREKVLKAIREFGYEPNLHASLLASGHRKNVVLLIPSPASGSFWTLSAEGMKNAAETVGPLGIDCKTVTYDQYDLASFRVACDLVLDSHPDGVVLAPMFHYESFSLGERLHAERIPFVLVDSKIENKNYLAYFGMQEYASGYLCGDQLTQGKTVERVLIVRISPDSSLRTSFLSFFPDGKNPSKTNLLLASPEAESATASAQGPGSDVTLMPSLWHMSVRTSPGSDMDGVPASVTSATFAPPLIFSMISTALSYLLCS